MNKTRKIAGIALTAVFSLMIGGSGIAKLAMAKFIVDGFTRVGVVQYTQLLGVADLVFLTLLLIPKTMKIGFVLMACYLAGAMGAHLSHGEAPMSPLLPMILLFVSTFLRDSSILLPSGNTNI